MSLYELEKISLGYGECSVLQDLDLRVEPGEFLGILGPNGAGKSTLLRLLAGLRRPSSGFLRFEGADLAAMPARERAKKIALVPQWTVMHFSYTAMETVLMGRAPHRGPFASESTQDLALAESAMRDTSTQSFRDRPFSTLSGGEMQRVVLARAIAQDGSTMLLDEPTSSLDLHHQQRIYEILRARNLAGSTVIVTTHDLNLAALYCRRLVLLHRGQIVAQGTPEQVITPERIREIYGVEARVLREAGRISVLPQMMAAKTASETLLP